MSASPETAASPPAYALPSIPHLRLRCTLRAREAASLPPYHGSLLRGAFGHALRAAVCGMGRQQECADCRLRRACPYPRVFETRIEGPPPPFLRGLPTAPRPYVFEPRTAATELAAGDPLAFDLLLFGQAAELSPYALLAVERMAAAGLGARRHRFALDRVESVEPGGALVELFAAGREPRPSGPAAPPPAADVAGGRATVRFLTPTRVKAQGRLCADLTFRALAFAMLRRALEIAYFHVPGAAIDWTFRPLLERAGAVRLAASFAALLGAAEALHVGKGATFGLGRIAVEAHQQQTNRSGVLPLWRRSPSTAS